MITIEKVAHNGSIFLSFPKIKRINVCNHEVLKSQISEMVQQSKALVVADLSNIHFIDSTGLNLLLDLFKESNTDIQKFAIANLHEDVQELLTISGLDEVFKNYILQ